MKKKTLEELRVSEIKKELFAPEDQRIFRFDTQGETLLTDIPIGSLIYTGKVIPGPAAGFHSAVCGIWKGKEEIEEFKTIILRHQKLKINPITNITEGK